MSSGEIQLDEKRLERAKAEIKEYWDKFALAVQRDILSQRVTIGMSPYEARLAAGAFYFKVTADPKVWPPNADPHTVMWAQSLNPDDSEILMTFETATQYPGEGMQRFRVHFRQGRAQEISKLKEKP